MNKRQKIVCIFLSLLLCFTPIVSSLNVIFSVILKGVSINAGFIYICYFVLLVIFLFKNIRFMPKKLFFLLMFFFASYFGTLLLFPQNIRYMWTTANDLLANPTYIWMFYVLPGFIATYYLKDIKQFTSVFEKFSMVSIVLLSIRFFVVFMISSVVPEYMTFSYNLLLPTTFMLLLCIKEFKLYRAFLATLGVILIFVAGCRGALLGVVISLLIYIFFFGKLDKNTKNKVTILLVAFLVIVLFFYTPILYAISNKLNSIGLNSRTLEKLLSSSIIDDSGRGDILNKAISHIDLFGHGLWGDRVILEGRYPHNFIVEMLIDYGWILGTGILIIVMIILFKGLNRSNALMSVVLCSLLSTGFVKLFLSGSFVNQEPAFYVLIGLCVKSYEDSFVREDY